MRAELDAPVLVGVGAAFDFHAGLVPQAPALVQDVGLEWAYRLAHEPRRLWRRYMRYNPRFVDALRAPAGRPPPRDLRARELTGAPPRRPARRAQSAPCPSPPRASIVIPTRDAPGYLDVTLASVAPQAARARRRADRRQRRRRPGHRARSPSATARA